MARPKTTSCCGADFLLIGTYYICPSSICFVEDRTGRDGTVEVRMCCGSCITLGGVDAQSLLDALNPPPPTPPMPPPESSEKFLPVSGAIPNREFASLPPPPKTSK